MMFVCVGAVASPVDAGAAAVSHAALSCPSAAVVNRAFSTSYAKALVSKLGTKTDCSYLKDGGAQEVIVALAPDVPQELWTGERLVFKSPGMIIKTVNGLGDEAFSAVYGKGSSQQSTIDILKGTTELRVTGRGFPLAKAEALAKVMLPTL